MTQRYAASHIGLPARTLLAWKARGEKFEDWPVDPDSAPEAERLYVKLAHEMHNARRRCLRKLELGMFEDVKRGRTPSGLQLLERLDRETWGRTEKVDHNHGLQIVVSVPDWALPPKPTQGELIEGEVLAEADEDGA